MMRNACWQFGAWLLVLLLGWPSSGWALNSFHGTVRDQQTGLPIAGAELKLFGVLAPAIGDLLEVAQTDEHGEYLLAIDSTGGYPQLQISVSHPDYLGRSTYATTVPGTHVFDFDLWRNGSARVVVRLVDALSGKPVAGTQVSLYRGSSQMFTGRSASDGRFVADIVNLFGEYVACAIDYGDDYLDQCHDGVAVPPAIFLDGTRFMVADGTDLEIVIPLEAAAPVEGTILDRDTGEPATGSFSFKLRDSEGHDQYRGAAPDEHGRYVLRGLSPGTYRVQVTSQGYPHYEARVWPDIGCTSSCDLEAGDPVVVLPTGLDGLDFTLGSEASVGGIISDVNWGVPLRGVEVTIGSRGGFGGNTPFESTVSGGDGTWRITHLRPGQSVSLFTQNEMGYQNLLWPNQACTQHDCQTQSRYLDVPSGDTLTYDFALSRGSAMSGKVHVAGSAASLPAEISIVGSSVVPYRADVEGEWMTPALPPGTYYVRAQYDRWGEVLCRAWGAEDCSLADAIPIIIDDTSDVPGIDFGLLPNIILRADFES